MGDGNKNRWFQVKRSRLSLTHLGRSPGFGGRRCSFPVKCWSDDPALPARGRQRRRADWIRFLWIRTCTGGEVLALK